MTLPTDSPIDTDVVFDWLRVTGEALGTVLDEARALGDRTDYLIGLLLLERVPPAQIRAELPDNVASSRRKVLGTGVGDAYPIRDGSTTPPRRPLEASDIPDLAARLRGPAQQLVWRHLLQRAEQAPAASFSAANVAETLTREGNALDGSTVRRALRHLHNVGAVRTDDKGRHVVSTAVVEFVQRRDGD